MRRSKRTVPRSVIGLFSLLMLVLVGGFEGGLGALPAWARRAWVCVSFGLGRTSLPWCPLDTWRAYPRHNSPLPNWQTGSHPPLTSGLAGSLARVARKRGWIWVSWPPLEVFRLSPGFLLLPGLAMAGARPCSGSPELRPLRSVAPGWCFDILSGSLSDRSMEVGPRSDSLEVSIPCVLGTCPQLAGREKMLLWDLAPSRVARSWEPGLCLGTCYPSRLGRGCGGPHLPAWGF